ncbi:zinc finger protein 414 isoform X2 [Triplophysa dalaica]|uniref:zinc finger protein 414 isoform X2 n=1 Tax=Triplophysa dalaica TaxID=1582913 RepID=UPI0024DF8A4E|nr:zinc finger protein 414 isoform X2 [Triplophysa dalaica]
MEGCQMSCSFYGCKRTYNNPEALSSHLQDHNKNTAQSLPGKVFLCSQIGCDGSFNNMQQLMEHMRHHYKPNNFFLCESCRAKLRSYRTLLKHLQTCAKVAKNKAAKSETGMTPDADAAGVPLTSDDIVVKTDPDDSKELEDMESTPTLLTHQTHMPVTERSPENNSFTNLNSPGSANLFLSTPSPASTPNLPETLCNPFPPTLSPVNPAYLPDPGSQQQRSPRSGPPSLPSSPLLPSSPGSNAVWRKNQGQSFNCRILWEHTRGRYSCLQCGHCTPDRGEMTAHIECQHKNHGGKVHNDPDPEGAPSSLLAKTSLHSENSTYTQL